MSSTNFQPAGAGSHYGLPHSGFTLLELALSSERLFPGDRRDRPFERGEACELRLDWCDGADAQGDLVRTLRAAYDEALPDRLRSTFY